VLDPELAQFDGQKYISLETFRKNGPGVKTPIWFVMHKNAFYVYTEADSWKVKRIRNNPGCGWPSPSVCRIGAGRPSRILRCYTRPIPSGGSIFS
jgi:hypothetical protein